MNERTWNPSEAFADGMSDTVAVDTHKNCFANLIDNKIVGSVVVDLFRMALA